MKRRAFFCGLAVSPLAALAAPRARTVAAEKTVPIKIGVDDAGHLQAHVQRDIQQAFARRAQELPRQIADVFARHG